MLLSNLAAANKPRSTRPLPKAKTQPARVLHVVDMGIQAQRPYQGEPRPPARTLFINFELVTDHYEQDGETLTQRISPRELRISADPKSTLTKLLTSLDPEGKFGGDLSKFYDLPCLVTVVHSKQTDKEGQPVTYANFGGAMPCPDGFPVPPLTSKGGVFSFDNPDPEVFNSLPNFIRDKIKTAVNFAGSAVEKMIPEAEKLAPKTDTKEAY